MRQHLDEREYESRHFRLSMVIPALFLFLFWTAHLVELLFELDLHFFGIYPLKLNGLQGLLLSPFVHGSTRHIWDNSVPFFVLATAVYYFYPRVATRVFFSVYVISGLWVWVFARPAWHIGASGLVYGLASFLFVSGILRREIRLLALSLLVVFLYGSLIWGIFPIYDRVSWESHMLGALAGMLMALWYRKVPPAFPPGPELSDEETDMVYEDYPEEEILPREE